MEQKGKLRNLTKEQKIELFEEDLKIYREKELINAVVSIQKVFKQKRKAPRDKKAKGVCIFEKDMGKLFIKDDKKIIVKCRVKVI